MITNTIIEGYVHRWKDLGIKMSQVGRKGLRLSFSHVKLKKKKKRKKHWICGEIKMGGYIPICDFGDYNVIT